MDKLDIIIWVVWFYAFVSSVVLAKVGFSFPIILLGYIPWLVAIALVIQRNAYE